MEIILDNIRATGPITLAFWIVLFLLTACKPQRFFNSIWLVLTLGLTGVFLAGLFGEYMGYALMALFLLMALALLLVPVLLIMNGVQMLKKEGRAKAHMLSLFLGIFVAVGEAATVLRVLGTIREGINPRLNSVAMLVAVSVFYVSLLILCFVLYSIYIQLLPHRQRFDYIIIHGCGLSGGKKVSPLLAARCDAAIRLYKKYKHKPILIPSGGQGPDEEVSEAEAMRVYLQEKGVVTEHILPEDRSATTLENLQFSKALIEARGGSRHTALISSNYHVYRCLLYARQLKMKCTGIGGKVALYYWPSALIREFVAVALQKRFLIKALLGYAVFLMPVIAIILYS